MNRKKAIFFALVSFAIFLVILIITLVKDRKSIIGYVLAGIFLLVTITYIGIYRVNDSITKARKKELENYLKDFNDINVISYDINNSNAYVEIQNEDKLIFVSIFNKKAYMDIFTKEESKRIQYLQELEDESLKKEGFMNLMKNKKGITLNVYKLSASEIFNLVKKEIMK